MKVLLTGGTGYIGSHTALSLAKVATHIVLYDNLSNSEIGAVERILKILQNRWYSPPTVSNVFQEYSLNPHSQGV